MHYILYIPMPCICFVLSNKIYFLLIIFPNIKIILLILIKLIDVNFYKNFIVV